MADIAPKIKELAVNFGEMVKLKVFNIAQHRPINMLVLVLKEI